MKCVLLAIFALLGTAGAQSLTACSDPDTRWAQTIKAAKDASLNTSPFSYTVRNKDLVNWINGLESYSVAFETEASANIDSLCFVVNQQQTEIEELKAQLQSLQSKMRREDHAPSH
jgi:uncharacterized coiled-coil protein SlyX